VSYLVAGVLSQTKKGVDNRPLSAGEEASKSGFKKWAQDPHQFDLLAPIRGSDPGTGIGSCNGGYYIIESANWQMDK